MLIDILDYKYDVSPHL